MSARKFTERLFFNCAQIIFADGKYAGRMAASDLQTGFPGTFRFIP